MRKIDRKKIKSLTIVKQSLSLICKSYVAMWLKIYLHSFCGYYHLFNKLISH